MRTIKGPGLFIAPSVHAAPTLRTLEEIAARAAQCGFSVLQIPTF